MGFTVTDKEGMDRAAAFARGSTDGADCINCPFSRLGRPVDYVTGEGPKNPHWIIVGEGPGRNEVVQQRPFVGTSGQLINEVLAKINVKRESLWITNATLCQPVLAQTANDQGIEETKRAARKACAPRLRRELAKFPGVPVLALGSHAAQGLTGDERLSITQMAGSCYDVDVDGTGKRVVIPSIHPAAILRGGSGGGRGGGGGGHTVDLAFWNLLYDASKVNLLVRGADIRFTDDIQIEVSDPARAKALIADFVRDARSVGKFACDTETYVDDPKSQTALSAVTAKLSAIGLATPARAISIAWAICYPDVLAPLDDLFADLAVAKVFHNCLYDIPVLEKHGFVIAGAIHDTMLMHHNAFPGLSHNLQRVTTQFYAAPPWKAEYRHGKGLLTDLLAYNARDTLATARIEGPIYGVVKRSKAEQTYEIDLAMAHAARIMHVKGVPVDRATNEQLRKGFQTNIDASRTALLAIAAKPDIRTLFEEHLAFERARKQRKNDPEGFEDRLAKRLAEIRDKDTQFLLDSGDHVAAFLKASNVPLSLQTASGRMSTRKDVLEEYVAYPEVRALLTYRENAKLLSTYVERMFTRKYPDGTIKYGFVDENDRVHPRWSIHKISGRWGSEAPVCQNVPKADKKKGRPNLRSQVIAPEGRAFVAFDAKQLEARLIALMSGDPFLLDIFRKDKDIHSELARSIWPEFDGLPVDERKVRRDLVKRPEYGAFYGGSTETLWKAVVRDYPSVTLPMIQRMVTLMQTKMRGVGIWHQNMLRTADRDGEIRSMFLGRRRVFPIKQFDMSEVVNFPIQSSGADLINMGLRDIMPRLPATAFPILQIHDAVVFECDEDDQDLVKRLVVESFTREESYNGNTLLFPVDARAGKSWSDVN